MDARLAMVDAELSRNTDFKDAADLWWDLASRMWLTISSVDIAAAENRMRETIGKLGTMKRNAFVAFLAE